MTDAEQEALALVNEVRTEYPLVSSEVASNLALCRAIERHKTDIADLQAEYEEVCKLHEAFRQEVSDAVEQLLAWPSIRSQGIIVDSVARFIIAKPLDPLVEAMQEWWDADGYANIETFRAAIEKRGGKIVWGEG